MLLCISSRVSLLLTVTDIMVVIDTLSKVAETFLQIVVKLHGFPKTIVSNHDSVYKFRQHLFKLSDTGMSLAISSYQVYPSLEQFFISMGV